MASVGRKERGQGMTEYIVLVGLVALLLIAGVNLFGFSLREAMQGTALSITSQLTPPEGADDRPGFTGDRAFSTDDGKGQKFDVYPVWDGDKYNLHAVPAGSGPGAAPGAPRYDPAVHGRS